MNAYRITYDESGDRLVVARDIDRAIDLLVEELVVSYYTRSAVRDAIKSVTLVHENVLCTGRNHE